MFKKSFQVNGTKHLERALLLPSLKLMGHEQMALDVTLLNESLKSGNESPILRFYQWPGYWLSLGKNQSTWPSKWNKLAKEGKLNLVRRPSGGSAVLHGGGLTYSLVWPNPHIKKKKEQEEEKSREVAGEEEFVVYYLGAASSHEVPLAPFLFTAV